MANSKGKKKDTAKKRRILVTGGSGFMGSNFLALLFNNDEVEFVANIDKEQSNSAVNVWLDSLERKCEYSFYHGDICDESSVSHILETCNVDTVVHFAAMTHVDDSIVAPLAFERNNSLGTLMVLEAIRTYNQNSKNKVRFHLVSTDEIYGTTYESNPATELTRWKPGNPYAASKAAATAYALAYMNTYGVPVTISFSANNFGPHQASDKLIPKVIKCFLDGDKVPVYTPGTQSRMWLPVQYHSKVIWQVIKTEPGFMINIPGIPSVNLDLINCLAFFMSAQTGVVPEEYLKLIEQVDDRLGHDKSYSIKSEVGMKPPTANDYSINLMSTVAWYIENYKNGMWN